MIQNALFMTQNTLFANRHIGEHDPVSAQVGRTSSKMWSPGRRKTETQDAKSSKLQKYHHLSSSSNCSPSPPFVKYRSGINVRQSVSHIAPNNVALMSPSVKLSLDLDFCRIINSTFGCYFNFDSHFFC